MSSVYRATDLTSARVVAVKVLEQSAHLEHAHHRFVQEVALLRRIESDVVVGVLDTGVTEDGTAYTVLEHIDGGSLEDLLVRRGRLEPSDVIALGLRLATGLAAAHGLGIVHGDIKPANILVPGGDLSAAKLGDFGLAESVQPQLGTTQAGMLLGTPSYMSPEQVRGLGRSPATDVWMLGVTLYECVYGHLPFEGPKGDHGTQAVFAVLGQILTEPAPLPPLPGGFETVLAVALHKAPEQRYATMSAFGDALAALERGSAPPRPGSLSSPGPHSPWEVSVSASLGDASFEGGLANTTSATKRWSPAVWVSLLCTFALIAGVVVTYVLVRRPADPGPPQPALQGPEAFPLRFAWWILPAAAGCGALFAAVAWLTLGHFERGRARARSRLSDETNQLRTTAGTRTLLSNSIAITLDKVIAGVGDPAVDLRRVSLALAIDDFHRATAGTDRRDALARAIELADKIQDRLVSTSPPWYVVHKEMLTATTALIAAVTALLSGVSALWR